MSTLIERMNISIATLAIAPQAGLLTLQPMQDAAAAFTLAAVGKEEQLYEQSCLDITNMVVSITQALPESGALGIILQQELVDSATAELQQLTASIQD